MKVKNQSINEILCWRWFWGNSYFDLSQSWVSEERSHAFDLVRKWRKGLKYPSNLLSVQHYSYWRRCKALFLSHPFLVTSKPSIPHRCQSKWLQVFFFQPQGHFVTVQSFCTETHSLFINRLRVTRQLQSTSALFIWFKVKVGLEPTGLMTTYDFFLHKLSFKKTKLLVNAFII